MKTKTLVKALLPMLLMGHCATAVVAQTPTVKKEEYRIKIMKVEDGKTSSIDTVFHSKDDLQKFQNEHLQKLSAEGKPVEKFTFNLDDIENGKDILLKHGDTAHGKRIMIKKAFQGETGSEPFTIKIEDENFEEHLMTVVGTDTTIKHNVIIKRMHTDSLHNVLKFMPEGIDSKVLEGELKNLPKGTEVRMVKIIAFINLEEPTKEELKKTNNAEMKKAVEEKQLNVNQLNVYPNPSNGKFALDFELADKGKTQLLVTDLQGKEVYKEEFVNDGNGLQTRQLDLSNQAGGFYLLKIKNGDKSLVKKIILQQSAE
jgi:hypothetical protein